MEPFLEKFIYSRNIMRCSIFLFLIILVNIGLPQIVRPSNESISPLPMEIQKSSKNNSPFQVKAEGMQCPNIDLPTIPFGQIEEVIINNFQHESCKITPSKKFKDAGMVIFAPQGLVSTTLREEFKSGLESYSTPYGDLYYLYPGAIGLLSIDCACWQIQSTITFYFAPTIGGELFLVERNLRSSGNSSFIESEWMEKAPWVMEHLFPNQPGKGIQVRYNFGGQTEELPAWIWLTDPGPVISYLVILPPPIILLDPKQNHPRLFLGHVWLPGWKKYLNQKR